eukprot:TRINITY_DN9691_c0_g1_i1.p1 TRINITY_DN9691_c0_g1~~TRINITY_DN9691_c0_g1_i1.p1  ORF type:complete len:365 (-),score=78.62 TRINITY_DN9691_c0_g1_i1:33-1127(-)
MFFSRAQLGIAENVGKRSYMEDRHIMRRTLESFPEIGLFGVFDGHGGSLAADTLKDTFAATLERYLRASEFPEHYFGYSSSTQSSCDHSEVDEPNDDSDKCKSRGDDDDLSLYGGLNAVEGQEDSPVLPKAEPTDSATIKKDLQEKIEVLKQALFNTYKIIDSTFLEENQCEDGSTALVALLWNPRSPQGRSHNPMPYLIVANAGDCRAVLGKMKGIIPLSVDHKPNRKDERERIEQAGGFITYDSYAKTWRVEGVLAMSRAIGDRGLKRCVIPDPEITVTQLDPSHMFFLLASDGLWDVYSNNQAVEQVRHEINRGGAARHGGMPKKLNQLCNTMLKTAMKRGSLDNITVMIVKLDWKKDETL